MLDHLPAATSSRPRSAGSRHYAGPVTCYEERALALWPRLNRAQLHRVADDPAAIARLVSHRTCSPIECIVAMLTEHLLEAASDPGPAPRGRLVAASREREAATRVQGRGAA
jgi:hypothetical protein